MCLEMRRVPSVPAGTDVSVGNSLGSRAVGIAPNRLGAASPEKPPSPWGGGVGEGCAARQ